MGETENRILYDWVSITSKIHCPKDFIRLLGLDAQEIFWEQTKGAHGYRDRLYWEKISIHYNGREDMGVWLEMSGQGCRAFETFGSGDYQALFAEVLMEPQQVHLTRLDVAFDDHSGILPMEELLEDAREGQYVSKARRGMVTIGTGDALQEDSILMGSRSSLILCRIYNKAAERGFKDGRHWIRVELMLKDERALSFIQLPGDVGDNFRGILDNYLRFVEPGTDSNRWRWPLRVYWDELLDGAGRIRLFSSPGADYNVINCEDFVFRQAGGAIFTLLELYGTELFLQKLKEQRGPLSAKYQKLLDEYGKR